MNNATPSNTATTHNSSLRTMKIDTLNELIAITRDSAKFYDEAATKVDNKGLKNLFTNLAAAKNGLVGAMSRDVKLEGATPAQDGTFRGSLHRIYGDVRAKLGSKDFAFVSELEASEDRMLEALNNVIKDKDVPAPIKTAVTSYLPKVQEQHNLMRDRKWAMETKH